MGTAKLSMVFKIAFLPPNHSNKKNENLNSMEFGYTPEADGEVHRSDHDPRLELPVAIDKPVLSPLVMKGNKAPQEFQ